MGNEGALQALLGAAVAGAKPNAGAVDQVGERLKAHLGPGAETMEMVTELVPPHLHATLQLALDAYLAAPGRTHELLGIRGGDSAGIFGMTKAPSLSDLLGSSSASARFGSVEYQNQPIGPGTTRPCVKRGLFLVSEDGGSLAVWVRDGAIGPSFEPAVDVVSADIQRSERFLAEIGRLMGELNVFKGQVVSVGSEGQGKMTISFAERFAADRDAVILPPGVLELLEEQTVGIGEIRDRLRGAGRHLKRGILLYGPPGTGKTHTIRYLTSQLPEYTVFLLTGSAMAGLATVGQLLPSMAPAVVVLDDVDLIAEDRDRNAMSPRRFLFDLLDLMDGLHDDLDVVFILTTNRVEAIEGAVSSRPGRVDTAVEVPLPDRAGLRRLLDLYATGIDLRLSDAERVITRTEGVTASFIREMLRRATFLAVREGDASPDAPVVTDAHVHAALDRLLDPAGPLTAALLGRREPKAAASPESHDVGGEWCPLA